jgi:hypothetical protein
LILYALLPPLGRDEKEEKLKDGEAATVGAERGDPKQRYT